MPGSFLDSNVLLYLVSDDEAKAMRAEDLVRAGGTISVQVLSEVANVARRKKKMAWPALREFLASLQDVFEIVPVTFDVHALGLDLMERYQLATYDAILASAALLADCDVLWTKDMHRGLRSSIDCR